MADDKSKPYFPLAGQADDGWSTEDEATATCFCGAVQLAFVSHLMFFDCVHAGFDELLLLFLHCAKTIVSLL